MNYLQQLQRGVEMIFDQIGNNREEKIKAFCGVALPSAAAIAYSALPNVSVVRISAATLSSLALLLAMGQEEVDTMVMGVGVVVFATGLYQVWTSPNWPLKAVFALNSAVGLCGMPILLQSTWEQICRLNWNWQKKRPINHDNDLNEFLKLHIRAWIPVVVYALFAALPPPFARIGIGVLSWSLYSTSERQGHKLSYRALAAGISIASLFPSMIGMEASLVDAGAVLLHAGLLTQLACALFPEMDLAYPYLAQPQQHIRNYPQYEHTNTGLLD